MARVHAGRYVNPSPSPVWQCTVRAGLGKQNVGQVMALVEGCAIELTCAYFCLCSSTLHHQSQPLHSRHASLALHGCAGDDTDDSSMWQGLPAACNHSKDTYAAEVSVTVQHCHDPVARAGSTQHIGDAPTASR